MVTPLARDCQREVIPCARLPKRGRRPGRGRAARDASYATFRPPDWTVLSSRRVRGANDSEASRPVTTRGRFWTSTWFASAPQVLEGLFSTLR
jgi:hypothetical protein